jgi:hypothetical protein
LAAFTSVAINAAATGRTQIGSFETPKVSPTKRAAAHAQSRRRRPHREPRPVPEVLQTWPNTSSIHR